MKKLLLTSMIIVIFFLFSLTIFAVDKIDLKTFNLKDYNGDSFNPSSLKDSIAVAYIFVSTRCPVSNAYNERMEKLFQAFKSKKIALIGINSNKAENSEEIKTHAKDKGLSFPILKDIGNKVADYLKASFTPEVFLLNSKSELIYHGRIDDSRRENSVNSKDLENAFQSVVSSSPIKVKETKAFGCSIKRVK